MTLPLPLNACYLQPTPVNCVGLFSQYNCTYSKCNKRILIKRGLLRWRSHENTTYILQEHAIRRTIPCPISAMPYSTRLLQYVSAEIGKNFLAAARSVPVAAVSMSCNSLQTSYHVQPRCTTLHSSCMQSNASIKTNGAPVPLNSYCC